MNNSYIFENIKRGQKTKKLQDKLWKPIVTIYANIVYVIRWWVGLKRPDPDFSMRK